jgi:hypothetical protein
LSISLSVILSGVFFMVAFRCKPEKPVGNLNSSSQLSNNSDDITYIFHAILCRLPYAATASQLHQHKVHLPCQSACHHGWPQHI